MSKEPRSSINSSLKAININSKSISNKANARNKVTSISNKSIDFNATLRFSNKNLKTNNNLKKRSSDKETSNISYKSNKHNFNNNKNEDDADSLDDGRHDNNNNRFVRSKIENTTTNNNINASAISSPDREKVNTADCSIIGGIENTNSMDISTNSIDDNKKSNRYAESSEREKLISRLLTEHSNKKQVNNTNNNDG